MKKSNVDIKIFNPIYSIYYHQLIGGAMLFKPTEFEKINGYSNLFFGWGGEDDNMFKRWESAALWLRCSKVLYRSRMVLNCMECSAFTFACSSACTN